MPALPALRAATAGVALLLVAVTAGDVLTRQDDTIQSPRADISAPVRQEPTTGTTIVVSAVLPTPTSRPRIPTATVTSVFIAAEAPTAREPTGDPAGDTSAGAGNNIQATTEDSARARSTDPSGAAADEAVGIDADQAAGQDAETDVMAEDDAADETADEAPAAEVAESGSSRDEQAGDAGDAGDDAAEEDTAEDDTMDRQGDARSRSPVVRSPTPTQRVAEARPPDPADIAMSQAAPELGTPGSPSPTDGAGEGSPSPRATGVTTARAGAPIASPDGSPAPEPLPVAEETDGDTGDRGTYRLAQVALGLLLGVMLALLAIVRRWDRPPGR